MSTIIRNDELYHYGVKGMKWGVRRFQNKDGTYTAAGKKRRNDDDEREDTRDSNKKKINKKVVIGSIAAATALAAIGTVALYKYKTSSYRTSISINSLNLGKYKVNEMNLDDMVIPKGSTMFRTSSAKTLRDGPVYLSTNKKDRDRYIHRMGSMYKNLYQMNIKSTKDLKIPSEKKQMEMFIDLLTNDENFSRTVAHNPYGITENLFGDRNAATKFAKNYQYDNFITQMIDYDPSKKNVLSTFADYVKSKGYDCLIDTNDIRTTSDNPIIALNKNDLIIESSKKVNIGMKFVSGLRLKNVKI